MFRRVYTSCENAFKGEKKSGYDKGWDIRIRTFWFCFHAPLLAVLDEYYVSKVMTSRTEEVKRDFPNAEVVHELEEITNDPAIELVIVTTPSDLHYEHAMACIQAGKHVVMENR